MSDWKNDLERKYGKAWTAAWYDNKCLPVRRELEVAKGQIVYLKQNVSDLLKSLKINSDQLRMKNSALLKTQNDSAIERAAFVKAANLNTNSINSMRREIDRLNKLVISTKKAAIADTANKYSLMIDDLNQEHHAQVSELKLNINRINSLYSDSQQVVAQKLSLIKEIEKKNKEQITIEKKLASDCKGEIAKIVKLGEDKKARNKKIGLGVGAAAVGYYFMNN